MLSQSPESGTVRSGTRVQLVIGEFVEPDDPTTTPDPVTP